MPLESLDWLIIRLPVDEYPVVLFRPEVMTVHVFLRHTGLSCHGCAPYLAIWELPDKFFVREFRARV